MANNGNGKKPEKIHPAVVQAVAMTSQYINTMAVGISEALGVVGKMWAIKYFDVMIEALKQARDQIDIDEKKSKKEGTDGGNKNEN